MARILCVGHDEVLLKTRRLMLEAAGHEVTSALDEVAARQACNNGNRFDIAVIGQSATPEQKQRIFEAVRQCSPAVRVLELYRQFGEKSLLQADDWLAVPATVPPEFVDHVNALATKAKR